MTPVRRAACGALSLVIAGLPFVLLLSHGRQSSSQSADTAHAHAVMRSITVSLPPMDNAPTRLERAQPPLLNSPRPVDQTSRSGMSLPAAAVVAAGNHGGEAFDDGTYLPASQLTEWPRQRAPDTLLVGEDSELDDGPIPAAWRVPKTVEAVLMIDEQGEVSRVQFHAEGLATAEREWLAYRLQALRFVPGRLYGRPVRSRLTVELVLD